LPVDKKARQNIAIALGLKGQFLVTTVLVTASALRLLGRK